MSVNRDECSLCGKTKSQVRKLIVGLRGAVCCDCIELCADILAHEPLQEHIAGGSLRRQVLWANQELPRLGLVTMHSGNASGLDRSSGKLYIKPSGMDYASMAASDIVELDLHTGTPVEGARKPSVDLPHHLFLYRNIPEIGGIVHTHSNYATAFAASGRPIPLVLTSIADEFGGEIPCAPYVDNEGEHIGRAILEHRNAAPAILLANHGLFAWGATPREALKAAAMAEDAAKTVWLALQVGEPMTLAPDEAKKWHDRYQNRYGQPLG